MPEVRIKLLSLCLSIVSLGLCAQQTSAANSGAAVSAASSSNCILSVPFFEDFEGNTWVSTIGFNAPPGVLDSCWSRSDTSFYYWRPQQGTFLNTSGPSGDHTTGSGTFMVSAWGAIFNGNSSTELESPQIDLSNILRPELSFWLYQYGSSIDRLELEVWDGVTWSLDTTINGQLQTNNSSPWIQVSRRLDPYIGDTIALRWTAYRSTNASAFQSRIAIDDVRLRQAPTCPAPDSLIVSNQTSNSISLNWTSGGANNWLVGYRTANSNSPLTIVPANSSNFTVSGLTAGTTYEFFVKDSCGLGDASLWIGPASASTRCAPLNLPYFEDLDDTTRWQAGTGNLNLGDLIDPCWSRSTSGLTGRWSTQTGPNTNGRSGPPADRSGTGNYFVLNTSGFNNGVSTIRTFSIQSVYIDSAATSAYLKYFYHLFGSDIGALEVRVINLSGGGGSTTLRTWQGQQQATRFTPWQSDSLSLNQFIGDTIVVRFLGLGNGSNANMAIDEITIDANNLPCNDPSNLSLLSQATDSLQIAFTAGNNSGGTTILWYDANIGVSSATTQSGISSPFTLNGLSPGTDYVIELFDSCGNQISGSLIDTLSTLTCPTASASFTFSQRFLQVNFQSNAQNADSLIWIFGDGNRSNALNPTYTYSLASVYQVRLVALNNCGDLDTVSVLINLCDSLSANFQITPSGNGVIAQADTTTGAIGYLWDFGDGSTASGAISSAQYADSSAKTITLTVWNRCGDTVSSSQVFQGCQSPNADWTYQILSPVNAGLRVQFDGSLSRNAQSYRWDFGDGNSATGQSPIHIYSAPSLLYEVTLTVTNACGDESIRRFRLNQLSVTDLASEGWKVDLYPLPITQGFVNLSLSSSSSSDKDLKIRLMTISGQKLKEFQISIGDSRLDLAGLSSGTYLLIIEGAKQPIRRKVVVQ